MNWEKIINEELSKEYFKNILNVLNNDIKKYNIFPKNEDIFRAFKLTKLDNVKCVILGQDPYHGLNQADGLAFSVRKGTPLPPSLKNIFKELNSDLGYEIPNNGDLTKWAKQGVLLLNTILTVREGNPNSHQNIGWEIFTDYIISILNHTSRPICFILWGNNAKTKQKFITNKNHLVLTGAHPSPLSSYRGFFGGKYFSKVNEFLKDTNQSIVDWNLVD